MLPASSRKEKGSALTRSGQRGALKSRIIMPDNIDQTTLSIWNNLHNTFQ